MGALHSFSCVSTALTVMSVFFFVFSGNETQKGFNLTMSTICRQQTGKAFNKTGRYFPQNLVDKQTEMGTVALCCALMNILEIFIVYNHILWSLWVEHVTRSLRKNSLWAQDLHRFVFRKCYISSHFSHKTMHLIYFSERQLSGNVWKNVFGLNYLDLKKSKLKNTTNLQPCLQPS